MHFIGWIRIVPEFDPDDEINWNQILLTSWLNDLIYFETQTQLKISLSLKMLSHSRIVINSSKKKWQYIISSQILS